jgi:hypothetical protein
MTPGDEEARTQRPTAPVEGERRDDDSESPQQQRETLRTDENPPSGNSGTEHDS